jgi:hypothetical protein
MATFTPRLISGSSSLSWSVALAIIAPMVAAAPQASAEPINRSNWVPNLGATVPDQDPLGDLWTFNCPAGGTVSVSVDTKDDTDTGKSNIDPFLIMGDAKGAFGFSDDNFECAIPPVCGFACPSQTATPCGSGQHWIIVRDWGANSCTGGGGYDLVVEVFAGDGRSLSERSVNLGGGPTRKVPNDALASGSAPTGPALDDEKVPAYALDFDKAEPQ